MNNKTFEPRDSGVVIRLLGPISLQFEGKTLVAPKVKKAQLLLGYLIVRNGLPAPRSELAAMLWPDSHDEVARFNLRQLLAGLRKDLGPLAAHLDTEAPLGLTFHIPDAWIDLRVFEENLKSNPRLSVELVRGPMLEGISAEWLDTERRRIDYALLEAYELLAESGDTQERLKWITKLVEADPFRESAQQKLISHLAKSGDLSGAARAYRQFEDLLRRELNVSPSDETYRLFQHPVVELRPKPAEPKGNIPLSPSSFIGRTTEMGHVLRLLDTDRLVTLTGSGGVGKTRLSLRIAEEIMTRFRDGVWFVELAPISGSDQIAYAVAEVLRVREHAGNSVTQALQSFLSDKNLLIVLDNCEHVLGTSAQFAESLLASCRGLRILATSRERFGIPGETAYRLSSLSFPAINQAASSEEVFQYESVRLFTDRARASHTEFFLNIQNAALVASICRRLDGIPLAIELAASRVRAISLEEIERRLDDCFQLLTGGSRTALPRQQTLRALIDWSYDLLSSQEKKLFARVSVFAGSWSLKAAEAICSAEGIHQFEVLDLLTSLVDKSLVVFSESGGQSRYRLLETVRQYADERLVGTGEANTIRSIHRDFFLDVVRQSHPQPIRGKDSDFKHPMPWLEIVRALDALDVEYENVRTAFDWSLTTQSLSESMQFCGLLQVFWQARGRISEGWMYTSRTLSLDGIDRMPTEHAWALGAAGNLAREQGEYEAARTHLEASRAIRERIEEWDHLCWTYINLGLIAAGVGDETSCYDYYTKGLELARRIDHRVAISRCLQGYAGVELARGDHEAAKAHFVEALAISRANGDGYGTAKILQALGALSIKTGDYATARNQLAESLGVLKHTGERVYTIDAIEHFGLLAHLEGNAHLAARLWSAAESLRSETSTVMPAAQTKKYKLALEDLRLVLGREEFQRAWEMGKLLDQDEALGLALLDA